MEATVAVTVLGVGVVLVGQEGTSNAASLESPSRIPVVDLSP